MKKIISIILVLATLLLCSCQATPDKIVVQNKNDGTLNDKIDNSTNDIFYYVPKFWADNISSNNVTITIDAQIETPQELKMPVVTVAPDEFTDEEAVSLIKKLINDKILYSYSDKLTKEQIQDTIIELKQYLADPNSELNTTTDKGTPEYSAKEEEIQNRIDYLTDLLPKAPQENYNKEQKTELRFVPFEPFDTYGLPDSGKELDILTIEGYTKKDGKKHEIISMSKNSVPPFYNENIQYSLCEYGQIESAFLFNKIDNLKNCNLSSSEAIKIGNKYLQELGIENMGLSLICSCKQYNEKFDTEAQNINDFSESYILHYTHKINDALVTYQANRVDVTTQYNSYWAQEVIVLVINDDGVNQFTWINPMQINTVKNSNVELLPFDDIKEIFKNNLAKNISYYYNDSAIIGREIVIDRIVLGLTKIRQKDSSEQILIPTWNFFGHEINKYDKPQPGGFILDENNSYTMDAVGQSYLTINAIDGSIIDVNQGY